MSYDGDYISQRYERQAADEKAQKEYKEYRESLKEDKLRAKYTREELIKVSEHTDMTNFMLLVIIGILLWKL